jgi:hypothetical protein
MRGLEYQVVAGLVELLCFQFHRRLHRRKLLLAHPQ